MIWLHLLCLLVYVDIHVSAEDVPKWPKAYHVKGSINVPYEEISEPFEVWYNNELAASRVDYYNGTVKTYQLSGIGEYGTYFKVEPVMTAEKCFKTEGTKSHKVHPQNVLPNMTGYHFTGTEFINDIKAEKWEQSQSETVFTMYLYWKDEGSEKVIVPLRFKKEGFDHFYLDFKSFDHSPPLAEVFKIENVDNCTSMDSLASVNIEDYPIYKFNPIKEFVENHTSHVDEAWQSYKQQFNKHYDQEEDTKRKNAFRHSMRLISSANRANLSYSLGINQMIDYTKEEMKVLTSCIHDSDHFGKGQLFQDSGDSENMDNRTFPSHWDWRFRGAVTPVRDQSTCGSCWTFMSTGAIEGAHFLKTNQLITLSEQALLDCAWNYGSKACDGARIETGFKWVLYNGGIPTAQVYGPYRGMDDFCHKSKLIPSVRIKRFVKIKSNCIRCIKQSLIKYGPVSVGMHATNHFKTYKKGVFSDPSCPKEHNHALLIVGYGEMDGQSYWLVKNSWGNWWGVDGYALVAMKGDTCGIMKNPVSIIT